MIYDNGLLACIHYPLLLSINHRAMHHCSLPHIYTDPCKVWTRFKQVRIKRSSSDRSSFYCMLSKTGSSNQALSDRIMAFISRIRKASGRYQGSITCHSPASLISLMATSEMMSLSAPLCKTYLELGAAHIIQFWALLISPCWCLFRR